jgi:predicted alternative tryptophan synthase beta-subunit
MDQAKKHAADVRAKALAPTIAKLRKAGFVSIRAITHELSEREILTAQGGKWAPKQRQATAAPRGKAGAFLERSPAADE